MKLTATFSNGQTISRKTDKPLAYAYLATNIYQTFTGFATTKEHAIKSASSTGKNVPKPHTIEIVEVTAE